MAELRALPYTPDLKDLEKAGIHADAWVWNPHWAEEYRLREEVNGGKPTSREVRLYRRRLIASFHRLFEGRCSGCGRFFRLRQLVLDHDHGTGLVRGAICCSCNSADELADPPLPPAEIVTENGLMIRIFEPVAAPSLWRLPDCCLCGAPEHIGTPCEKEVSPDGVSS